MAEQSLMYDLATITVKAGRGGDGMMSFRREARVPRGGPDGGNGGRGGDVILVVNPRLNTLAHFQHRRRFEAESGRNGGSQNKTGRSGKPKYIEVPPGTLVRDAETGRILGDLVRPGQQLIVARGGRGGRGNAMFATPTNQSPQIAENGEPGERRTLRLELKLIADIGIVGLPNAGKSTLLSVLTAAKPKIADYPFTTLRPNLGVAYLDEDRTVVLADIPGLIEGASQGVGLGHDFLRHIERTRVLIHLLDGLSNDPLADYETVNREMAAFGHGLTDKPQVVAMTKMDLPDARAAFELFVGEGRMADARREPPDDLTVWLPAPGRPLSVLPISAATGENVRELLHRAVRVLDALPPLPEIAPEPDAPAEPPMTFEIVREGSGFRVISPMLERRVQTTRWDLDDAVLQFQRLLERSGVGPELERLGIQPGDTVYIGDYELEWREG
ncbi:MAG: GTPase ObgE [Thermoflexales bacterium]|nr:GTPase ObgE [Thermoflexales bacterium]MDW8351713.1 GTPase ObgE [Anaerolineae bacterium]